MKCFSRVVTVEGLDTLAPQKSKDDYYGYGKILLRAVMGIEEDTLPALFNRPGMMRGS